MRSVAVTGASGMIGRRVVAQLRERPDIDRVLALDIEPAPESLPGVETRLVDVRDPDLARVLAGCDAVVHLAFVVDQARDEQAMHDVNVGGSQNVIRAAAEAGVSRVIFLSSAMAYGAHSDNDVPLTEDAPLRGNPDLAYARHKVEVETWLSAWASEPGRPSVAVLRPSIVIGPGLRNALTWLLETTPFVLVRGHRPPIQFTHVEDVASAIELLLEDTSLVGAFNCASEGWLSSDEFLAVTGVRHVDLPLEIAYQLSQAAWKVGLSPAPPALMQFAMHPWVVAVDRLVDAGWRPKHSNRDSLAELAEEHREHLALGPVRVRRKDLARGALVTGALGLGVVTARRLLSRR